MFQVNVSQVFQVFQVIQVNVSLVFQTFQTFQVNVSLVFQVVPVNDEPPQLSRGLRRELRCEEGGRVQVSLDYLRATDPDSEDSRLSYMLTRRPARGQLQNQGLEVERFTQQDLLLGHIYYVHTGEDP